MGPVQHDRTADVVSSLRRTLHRTFESAGDAAQSSRNAFGLAVDLVAIRRQLAVVRDVLTSRVSARRDALVDAVWGLYHDDPEVLSAETRAGVVRAWTHLLIDAAEKVEHDERWAARYAAADSADEEKLVAGASRSSSSALRDP